jgi:hypothetical protein
MDLFHIIDDVQVITRSRGVFRQVALYRRGNTLFAKHGGGYVKLMSKGGTSAPKVSWVNIEESPLIKKDFNSFEPPVFIGL